MTIVLLHSLSPMIIASYEWLAYSTLYIILYIKISSYIHINFIASCSLSSMVQKAISFIIPQSMI